MSCFSTMRVALLQGARSRIIIAVENSHHHDSEIFMGTTLKEEKILSVAIPWNKQTLNRGFTD